MRSREYSMMFAFCLIALACGGLEERPQRTGTGGGGKSLESVTTIQDSAPPQIASPVLSPQTAPDSVAIPADPVPPMETEAPPVEIIASTPKLPVDPIETSVSPVNETPATPIEIPASPVIEISAPIIETPAPVIPVEIPDVPKEPQTLKEAIAAIDAYRGDVEGLDSFQITDYGKKFWLGDGYDVLTGNRTPTCFDPAGLKIQSQPLNQTFDSFDVVHNYVELFNRLEAGFGAEIGGIWQMFTGKLSVKTNIMRETQMSKDDVVVVAGFTHAKDQISIYNAGLDYAEYFGNLSKKNRFLFRKNCGDRFTKDVAIGASMYIVLTARKNDSSKHKKTDVESAISFGLANILTVGASGNVSQEQKEILKSYTFSSKCYTAGTSANVCAAYSLNTAFDIANDRAKIQEKVEAARRVIVSEVNAGNNLVVVRENLMDYEVPAEACTLDGENPCPSRWTYFSDYRERLKRNRDLNLLKGHVEEVCRKTSFWTRRCAAADQDLSNAIMSCANTAESCNNPDRSQIDVILSARNPGKVSLYTNAGFGGDYYEVDFNEMSSHVAAEPLTFQMFRNIGWQKANDRISSLKVELHPAWTVRFYEHPDSARPGYQYDVSGRRDIPWIGDVFGRQANDKISAFELLPIPDLN